MPLAKNLRFESHEAFAAVAGELYRRSGMGRTESGAFLLGQIDGHERSVRKVIYFDDVDPQAYRSRAIRFNTTRLGVVYDACEREGLSIVGDIHVHPEEAFLSPIDEANPVVAVAGHVGIILPYSGRYQTTDQISVHILDNHGGWLHVGRRDVTGFLGLDTNRPSVSAFDRTELYLLNRNVTANERRKLLSECAVQIVADDENCTTPAGQAALLTSVALCTRFCRGGVFVRAPRDAKLHSQPGVWLSQRLLELGANRDVRKTPASILIGRVAAPYPGFNVGLNAQNGTYGCAPSSSHIGDDFVPGVVAATALAVGEIFRSAIMQKVESKPRERSIELWSGTERTNVPGNFSGLLDRLWLTGFGHLGNAYAWTLAMIPGCRPRLLITDNQRVDFANASTQLFVRPADVGRPKVEVAKSELSAFGFEVRTDNSSIEDSTVADRPEIVLSGFDNVLARRALAATKSTLIVDGGIGREPSTFSTFSVNTLTDPEAAIDAFVDVGYESRANERVRMKAYEELAQADETLACGLYGVADASVAVPFVGATVASVAVTQIIRHALNLPVLPLISGDALGSATLAPELSNR